MGTHAAIPNIPGLEAAKPLTHIEALELDILPAHLIVIGGGYAGLELAQAYRRFGAEVTVVEAGPQLMGREDPDASQEIRRILTGEGIQIHLDAERLRVSGQSGDRGQHRIPTGAGEQTIEGSHILVAAGRIPNTAGIGLEKLASSSPIAVSSRSTSGWRRARRMSGRLANAPAARCSPTYPKTTFASFGTILLEGAETRATGSFPIACSPIRRWRMLD